MAQKLCIITIAALLVLPCCSLYAAADKDYFVGAYYYPWYTDEKFQNGRLARSHTLYVVSLNETVKRSILVEEKFESTIIGLLEKSEDYMSLKSFDKNWLRLLRISASSDKTILF